MAEWISVKDRLPAENGRYLCNISMTLADTQEVLDFALNLKEVDKYDFPTKRKGFYKWDNEWGYFEVQDVTHWMPLPEPPKGE